MKTAIQQSIDKVNELGKKYAKEKEHDSAFTCAEIAVELEDLLELEKRQIEDAFDMGVSSVLKNFDKAYSEIDGEEYFETNYKKQ